MHYNHILILILDIIVNLHTKLAESSMKIAVTNSSFNQTTEKNYRRNQKKGKMQNGDSIVEQPRPLFETIGKGAQDVDNIPDDEEESQKLVEEIESMCINCEDNVHYPPSKFID